MERASKSQQQLLDFIEGFIAQHSYGPSYREMMRALDYKSVSTVATHIDGLVAKGFLRKKGRSARSLEVVKAKLQVENNPQTGEVWLEKQIAHFARTGATAQQLQTVAEACELLGFTKAKAVAEARLQRTKIA